MTSKYILGLDVSTRIIGYTLIDAETGDHVRSDAMVLDQKASFVSRASQFHDQLEDLNVDYNVSQVWIEEPFMMFSKGGSSAQTMSRLSSFNGSIQYMCYMTFGFEPNMINANHARKTLDIKIQREKICGVSTKEQILAWVKTKIPNFNWPTKILKSGPRKGLQVEEASCYDIADSFVVAKAGFVKIGG